MSQVDLFEVDSLKSLNQQSQVWESEVSQSKIDLKFCLLGASYNTGNLGVAALASGTINTVLHSFPGAKVFLLDYDKKPRTHAVRCSVGTTQVELVNLRFSWKIWLGNNIARLLITALGLRLVPLKSLRGRLIARNPYLNRIQGASLIASIAGGDSFSDIYGLGRLLYVSLPQVLVILMGKPLVLLPQTLGPFKGTLARGIARWIIRRAKVVCVRDRESITDMQSIVGREASRFQLCYDIAFAMEPFPPSGERLEALKKLEKCRPLVGLNVSGLLYMGGYSKDNMFGLKADYRQLILDIIRCFVNMNAHVLLIPHVFGHDPESDATASAVIYQELNSSCGDKLHLLEGDYDQHEIKFVIGRCDFFLGSRMHACIGGLSQCVPAIGLAYSRKFRGVLRSVGMEGLIVDLREHDSEEIMTRVRAAYESREGLRARLKRTMPRVREEVLNLLFKMDLAQWRAPEVHSS